MTRFIGYGFVLGTLTGLTNAFSFLAGDSFVFSLWKEFIADLAYLNKTIVPGYLGFYLMGHYVHTYGLGKWHRSITIAAVPALLLSGVLTVCVSNAAGFAIPEFLKETNPLIAIGSAGIFGLFMGEKGK